jgi:hypothetical protein
MNTVILSPYIVYLISIQMCENYGILTPYILELVTIG